MFRTVTPQQTDIPDGDFVCTTLWGKVSSSRSGGLFHLKVSKHMHRASYRVCRKLHFSCCCKYLGPETSSTGALAHRPLPTNNALDVVGHFSGP